MSEISEPTKTLAAKLIKVYQKVDSVEKRGRNITQNYNYVKSADTFRAIREALIEIGVYALPNFTVLRHYEIPKRDGGAMQATDVSVEVRFIDIDTGASLTSTALGSGADSGDKAVYKAMTGSYKNALRNAFLVPDESDPEADEETDKHTTGSKPVRKAERVESKPSVLPTQRPLGGDLPHATGSDGGTYQATDADVPDLIGSNSTESAPSPTLVFSAEGKMFDPWKSRANTLVNSLREAGLTKAPGEKLLSYILNDAGTSDKLKLTVVQFETATKEIESLLAVPATKQIAVNRVDKNSKEKEAK